MKEAHRCLDLLSKAGWEPSVREVLSFHDHPAYGKALVQVVRNVWEPQPGSKLLVSYHSTLMKDIQANPTYKLQTEQTTHWLGEDLGMEPSDALVGYQSRFDSRKWLQPFSEHILPELADQGTWCVKQPPVLGGCLFIVSFALGKMRH